MRKQQMVSRDEVAALLDYSPDTGKFTWRVRRGGMAQAGTQAGSIDTYGYAQIGINRTVFLAHRLAWLLSYGVMPDGEIDHINGDRSDNRIENLRLASKGQNCQNSALRSDSSSGFKGVSRHQKKYQARISFNKKLIHLGYFETPEAAHEAYRKAAAEYFGEFARYA